MTLRNRRAPDAESQAMLQRDSESEIQLRQLAESIPIMVVLVQLEPRKFLYVSPASRDVLGLEPEQVDADPRVLVSMVHPDDRERVMANYVVDARAGRPAVSEHRILMPDGEVRWIRLSSGPVANPDGPPTRSFVTLENITEHVLAAEALREAEAAARTANEAKNHFLSRVSHELRTPLNAVLGFGQLLEAPLAGTEHAPALRHILTGGWHLLDLINDVLDIARIESGEIAVRSEAVPIGDLANETVALMRPIAEDAQVVIADPLGPRDCHVLADRQRVRQILLNLLSNAVKYNRPGGQVWVTWMVDGGIVTVTVRDDGPGIAPELLPRLFTPFDRLGAEVTGVEGTGIGLALTRSLAHLMNGDVTVQAPASGGSSFVVTLPLTTAPAPGTRTAGPADRDLAPAVPDGEPSWTVLYVEDNDANAQVFEQVVALRPRWRLIRAETGRQGVELAGAHRPDLVFLDLHLPDLGGAEVLRALRADPVTASTPVLILTADALPAHEDELLAAGADRYLTKPLRVAEILRLLDDRAAARTP